MMNNDNNSVMVEAAKQYDGTLISSLLSIVECELHVVRLEEESDIERDLR